MLLMKRLIALLLPELILSAGCATVWAGKPPACPPPTMESVEEMVTVMVTGNYPSLIGWISEMERYCSGIDAMRDL